MTRTKGTRKGGKTKKRIGTKRMRRTSMKGRSKKRSRRMRRSMRMRGGASTTINPNKSILSQMERSPGGLPAAVSAGSVSPGDLKSVAYVRGGGQGSELKPIEEMEKFKKFLEEELYITKEDYREGVLTIFLQDIDKLRVISKIEELDLVGPNGDLSTLNNMLEMNLDLASGYGILISEMKKLYKAEEERLAAKAEQERRRADTKMQAVQRGRSVRKAQEEAAAKAEHERLYKVNTESKIKNFLTELHLDIDNYEEEELKLRVDHYKNNNEQRPVEARAAEELVKLIKNLQVDLDQLDLPKEIINELEYLM